MNKHLFLALVASLGLGACRQEALDVRPATLILGFGNREARGKSFMPEELAVVTIKIEALGPGGERLSSSSTDFSPVELELIPGSWMITAKGLNAKGLEVAWGLLELSVSPSARLRKDLFLSPSAGEGSVSLSWTIAGLVDGALRIEGSLSSPSGSVVPISSPSPASGGGPLRFEGLRNGAWTLELRLFEDGSALCGLADGVLVAAGMETRLAVAFKPPAATLAVGLVLPEVSALAFQVEPSLRRASRGTGLLFRAPVAAPLAWYAEGSLLPESGAELLFAPPGGALGLSYRLDCVQASASPPRSGGAEARLVDGQALGPLVWGELVSKAEGSAAAQGAMRALGDCRDLAWSPGGGFLAAAGRESNAVSLFEAPRPGASFAKAALGGAAEPRLLAPSVLRFLPDGSLLALSESAGSVYSIAPDGSALRAALAEPCLAGGRDMAVAPNASAAYVAASGADCLALVALGAGGLPLSARPAAARGAAGLESFSRPYCLALSPDGSLLAAGTAGDDALYFFSRDGATEALNFACRIDKSAFPAEAPLSDPCSLAFSPDGSSLFVLSYYGRALIRLDRAPGSSAFAPAASARSGAGAVTGFATPRRLALSPDGRLAAVAGSGAGDGLALFRVEAAARLDYLGTLLPSAGSAVPPRPSALAFSPEGSMLALAADGYLSLFALCFP